MDSPERLSFRGDGITLVADAAGPRAGLPVLFLHGSGQTRHSWRKALREAAARGFRAIALDLRGHGDSEPSPDGLYTADLLIADIRSVVTQIGRPPVVVGASIGGLVGMALAASPPPALRAVVLVDITPQPEPEGIEEVRGFMASAQNGFASLDEAADAVAAYLPHRARPKDTSGLARNLRLREGRYHWHWDPAFFFQMAGEPNHIAKSIRLMTRAAEQLTIPTLLIRGGSSTVVSEAGARAFLALVPHADYANIAGAHHMVAGDANDAFNEAVFAFLDKHGAASQA